MPFQIALSGLNAASTSLSTTANNIANVNTLGFKGSRANFVELFATGLQNVQDSATGLGTRTSSIQQQFSQGSLEFTDNNLDLALIGAGFFSLADEQGALSYTRAGNFSLDRDGFIVNDQGLRLQGFPARDDLSIDTGRLDPLSLNTISADPSATKSVELALNLPADAEFIPDPTSTPATPVVIDFDADEASTFNHSTSVTIFDSLGIAKSATYYFQKTPNDNEWNVFLAIDGRVVSETYGDPDAVPPTPDVDPRVQTLQFEPDGSLPEGIPPFAFFDDSVDPPVGGFPGAPAEDLFITTNIDDLTQFGSSFTISRLSQDGFASGRLASIQITPEGIVAARFTNGVTTPLGQVAITNFTNPEGLENLGDTRWAESADSGQAQRGIAGTGNLGVLQSGAIETSNVNLAEQLVKMIVAQRTFQANAQMITTADQVTQTVINIR